MLRLSVAAALLALAAGSVVYSRNGCGCLRNPIARQLDAGELLLLRNYVAGLGVKHAPVLTDASLQAVFRFNLLNNFPDVVPSRRSGVIQVVTQGLSELTDSVLPSAKLVAYIKQKLQREVAQLAAGKVNIDLSSLVPAAAVVLHQRGVPVPLQYLGLALSSGLSGYLQSPAYQVSYNPLSQLLACLDHIDHNIPSLLEIPSLIPLRKQLENRFNIEGSIFDARFKQAVRSFEANRERILQSFQTLASRGSGFEVSIQSVIARTIQLFPGLSSASARAILNILQLTNSAGGRSSPKDLLAIIVIPPIDKSLRFLKVPVIRRIQLHLPSAVDLTVAQVNEAYALFIIGLASQGIQPLQLQSVQSLFIKHLQRFFLVTNKFTPEDYILYVIRVVVPEVPRGSSGFNIRLFDPTIVVDNVLVPEPLKSIYIEGRKTIIPTFVGLQGSSDDIHKRIVSGEGDKPFVKNTVFLKPISAGPLPKAPLLAPFTFGAVQLTGAQFGAVSSILLSRFGALTPIQLQLPILQILVRAGLVSGNGLEAAAAFGRLFKGLPVFPTVGPLGGLLGQLSQLHVKLTEQQVLGGLQQFFVVSRALGHVIPPAALPGLFATSLRQYIATKSALPAQPFNFEYLKFLQSQLAAIIQRVVLVHQKVPLLGRDLASIFIPLRHLDLSGRAQRTIVRFIDSSNIVKTPLIATKQAVGVLQGLLSGLSVRFPHNAFILNGGSIKQLRHRLRRFGIKVTNQLIRDANGIALCGLGLFGRLDAKLSQHAFRGLLRRAIFSFVRTNNVVNIPTTGFIKTLYGLQRLPLPLLPVPVVGPNQSPQPIKVHPVPILTGLALPESDVNVLVSVLRRHFSFVSIDNVQAILAHVVTLKRSSGVTVTSKNLLATLSSFLNSLPSSLIVGTLDFEEIRKSVDKSLESVTITGNGIRSGIVETALHLYSLNLPLPSPKQQQAFFSFVIAQYGRTVVRQQLRFGKPFAVFLSKFLPTLGGFVKPFPLLAAPQLLAVFEQRLQPQLVQLTDVPLLIQTVVQSVGLSSKGLSLSHLLAAIARSSGKAIGPLSGAEIAGLLSTVSKAKLKAVSAPVLRRAFGACRLAVLLGGGRALRRAQVVRIFSRAVLLTLRQHQSLLVPQLVPGLVGLVKQGIFGLAGGSIKFGGHSSIKFQSKVAASLSVGSG